MSFLFFITNLEGGRTLASKDRAEVAVHTVGQRELESRGQQLLNVGTTDLRILQLSNLNDLDGAEASAMSRRQILVHGSNGLRAAHLSVLLVHVVRTSARVVADPDTKVLHLQGVALEDLVDRDDLTVRLLDLFELTKEVPEAGLGDDGVWRKDAHLVELGLTLVFRGELAADDLVLVQHLGSGGGWMNGKNLGSTSA